MPTSVIDAQRAPLRCLTSLTEPPHEYVRYFIGNNQKMHINLSISQILHVNVVMLKVVSAMLGRNINDHIHLIFPHDPLAARPISRQ